MHFSIIIPVFNRPNEIDEMLESLQNQDYSKPFEVIIIEDGSTLACVSIIAKYSQKLEIKYIFKENSGPGDSRNFGMKNAKGDYFLIFDSDCVLPTNYISVVEKKLSTKYVDCFGGPDAADKSFSTIQKAINFSMTSFLTTGGIRGNKKNITKFEPRSFNLGISKKAFQLSAGFGNIHPGEDPDLSIRLWKLGFETAFFEDAFVYHKRRISWDKFYTQVNKFGKVRVILNLWHPKYSRITYFFPSLFIIGFVLALIFRIFGLSFLINMYAFYFLIIFIFSSIENKSLTVGFATIQAVAVQFYGYGIGFMQSYYQIFVLKNLPEKAFPALFFIKKQ